MTCCTNLLPLLHPGAPNASSKEQIADCLLAYPNSLWHGRKVVPLQNDGTWEISYERTACLNTGDLICPATAPGVEFESKRKFVYRNTGSSGVGIAVVVLGPFYLALIELPALFCSAIGMPMKQSALNESKKAAVYNDLMQLYLRHEELLAQKEIIAAEITENTKSLEIQKGLNEAFGPAVKQLKEMQLKYKESNEVSKLLDDVGSKQKAYTSLANKKAYLQNDMDIINQDIENCKNNITIKRQAYSTAID